MISASVPSTPVSPDQAILGTMLAALVPVSDGVSGRFWCLTDFPYPQPVVAAVFRRAAASGAVLKIRRDLFWCGAITTSGMVQPSVWEVALRVGGPGTGLTGVSAANFLGLSTQALGILHVAVPGGCSLVWPSLKFVSRSLVRLRLELSPVEVAVLEVLRDVSVAEGSWADVVAKVKELEKSGLLRRDALSTTVASESSIAASSSWRHIRALL